MKQILLFITVLLTGLSAGFFLAWSMSVIVGTQKVGDFTYLEVMQNINREIQNPVFFTVFFGSLLTLICSSFLQRNISMFGFILAATVVYAIGTFGVTALGNVPLNNELDVLNIHELNKGELQKFRIYFEQPWNSFHQVRTVTSIISFILLLIYLNPKHSL